MKKRLLSGFLCLCMVLTLLPVPARAADPTTVTTADELATAMEAGGEIVLGCAIDVSQPLSVAGGREVTLDLNGYAITATGSFFLFSVGSIGSGGTTGKLTVTDSSTGGSITGESKLFHVGQGSKLSLGGGIVLTSNNANDTTAPALQNEFGTVNVLEGGFSITSEANNAIYNHGGTFNGNNISFTASTGNSGSGAALKLDGGTVTGLNATVTSGRTDPAILVADGSVEITGGSYTASGSVNGALYAGTDRVTLKGGTFSNASYSGNAISMLNSFPYFDLLGKGFGYTTNDGTTFLTEDADLKAATSLTVMPQSAQSSHTHAVSVNCETTGGTQVAFQALPDMSGTYGGHTLTEGSYYLDASTTVNGSLTINGNVTLCLNGHTLTPSGGAEIVMGTYAAISVPQGSSLTVCDCGQLNGGKISLQISEALLGSRGHAAIGGAGDVTLYGCAVEINKRSAGDAYGLCNTGGAFTLYDSRISATHTTSGVNQSPFANAVEGRGGTTVIHGGTLSATVTNGTAYPYDSSGAHGLRLFNGSTAYLLGNPTITTSNNTNTENQADVYVSSPEAQFWLSKDSERYGEAALTVWVSKSSYSNPGGGTVIRGVGKNGNVHTIKNAPNRFVGTVIDTEGRKDLVLTGPYTVKFDANGGQGTMTDLDFTGWEDSKALTTNGFTGANGAIFQSWNTKADGSGTNYADGAAVSGLAYGGTVTLYAQWGAAQGHTHVWDTGWTFDAGHHWHKCTAQGCDITNYKQSHLVQYTACSPHDKTWVNTNAAQHWQTCATCGWTDTAANHVYDNDQDAECNTCGYTRTVTPPTPTYGISGKVTELGGNVEGATVKLMKGSEQIGQSVTTNSFGVYSFQNVAPGLYNVVVVSTKDSKTMTILVRVENADKTDQNLYMPTDEVSSVLDVKNTPVSSGAAADVTRTAVDGLVSEASSNAQPGKNVTVTMTVESKTEANADNAAAIKAVAPGKTLELLAITVEKLVDTDPAVPITQTANLLTIIIPFDRSNKTDITVYRYHGTAAEALPTTANGDGEYFVVGSDTITIHAKKFSTYAIGYTTDGGGNQPQPPSGGGSWGGGYVPPTYAVDLPASTPGGKLSASPKSASSGATVTLTLTPEEGYEIGGVTVTDQNGKTVAVTDKGGGKYTFTMPSGKVTVKAAFTKSKGGYADCPRDNSCPIWRFPDADPAAWYHDGVHYCVEHGLMSGYGGQFRPDDNLSRAEFVQVLHNLEGRPVVNYLMGFEDVPGGAWYAEAVRWAASRQIAGGYGNGRFDPNHGISREELAVMLWRYAGRPSAAGKRLNFADAEKASGWATEALCWAVDQGILQGKDGGILDPKGMTTRAEAAAVLQRVFGREQ